MFGLGMGEIVVILVVALLVLGPTQLPEAAKQVGKAIRQLRRHTRDLQETIDKDEAIGSTVRELKSALRGDDFADYVTRDRRLPPNEQPVAKESTPTVAETPAETAPAAPPEEQPKTTENG